MALNADEVHYKRAIEPLKAERSAGYNGDGGALDQLARPAMRPLRSVSLLAACGLERAIEYCVAPRGSAAASTCCATHAGQLASVCE